MLAGALLLTGCAWLDEQQRQLVLRPTPGAPANFGGLRPSDESYRLELPERDAKGRLQHIQVWWLPHPKPDAPALFYLHGTLRNLYGNIAKIEALREAGFSVFAVDYRGWGDSTELVPSEATIVADANLAWREFERREPLPQRRVIYGHSMGGGVAVDVASRKLFGVDYAGLVLESTFTRMPDVAAENGFLGRLAAKIASQQFDSISKIKRVDAPILILHGTADDTVPVVLGRRLHAAAPAGAQLIEIPGGGHSGLQTDAPALYQATLSALAQRLK